MLAADMHHPAPTNRQTTSLHNVSSHTATANRYATASELAAMMQNARVSSSNAEYDDDDDGDYTDDYADDNTQTTTQTTRTTASDQDNVDEFLSIDYEPSETDQVSCKTCARARACVHQGQQ